MRHLIRLLPLLAAAVLALPAAAFAAVTHTVRRGETLTSIAAADGLSVSRLAAANGLSSQAELVAGTQLVIPPQGGPVTVPSSAASGENAPSSGSSGEDASDGDSDDVSAPAGAATASPSGGGYVVRPGDTLSGIAARFGTTPAALAAANGMSVGGVLLAGRTLSVSGSGAVTPAPAASTSTATAQSGQPVAEYVAPSEVGSIAAAAGVPAPLAEAVADQESGFNDAMVSSSGATGVMQLEPSTWSDLTRVDGMALSPSSPLDNVRGGVAVLHALLLATGGDQAEAIAAYYQGLDSVRTRGILPGTRHYVSDVLALESRFGG